MAMGRSKRRRDFPDNVEDMTVEQLRDELLTAARAMHRA
jgi:hypothetical protein